jgi:mycothiol synthase
VLQLAAAAMAGDEVAPLSEHVMLHLRYGGGNGLELTSGVAGHVTGYAYLEVDESGVADGELVVGPAHRRRGAGRALLAAMTTRAGERPLCVRAHSNLPAAAALA